MQVRRAAPGDAPALLRIWLEASRVGPGYRLFVSDAGERRRYTFGPHEVHDATLADLREQLARAEREG